MSSPHQPTLTPALLQLYSSAALRNADDLLAEAALLCDHGHMARAYFLAVACIEEAGKALLAFDSQNRNLSDPGVCTKLKKMMETHGDKINYALSMWALSSPNQRETLLAAADTIGHIKRGREPSMYSDLRNDKVQTPREVVRDIVAQNCVELAHGCLQNAHRHVSEKTPVRFTKAEDRLLTMKPSKFQALFQSEAFLLYYLSRLEAGDTDFAGAVHAYERDHVKTGAQFGAGRDRD